jgi:hypothetical protein
VRLSKLAGRERANNAYWLDERQTFMENQQMGTPKYNAAMLAIDRLLDEMDDAPTKERAAILYALIENQEEIVKEEIQRYRIRCENLYRNAARLVRAVSQTEILPEDWDALKLSVADSKPDFEEE